MNNSNIVKEAFLHENVGKDVTVILGSGGESSVFSGVLQEEVIPSSSVSYWTITSERGLAMQNGTPIPVPETKVFFATEQLGHLVVSLETAEEALEKIQAEQKGSGLVDTRGQVMQ